MDSSVRGSRINRRRWAGVNAAGFGLGFFLFIPAMLLMNPFMPEGLRYIGPATMPSALDPAALPDWLDRQTYSFWYLRHLSLHIVGLAIFGGIVGAMQTRLLPRDIPSRQWVVATSIGFASVLLFEIIERHMIIGPHAGPFEPVTISVGGGVLAGVGQWFVLRMRGFKASRWLATWVGSLVVAVLVAAAASIGASVLAQQFVDAFLTGSAGQVVTWASEITVLGVVLGAVAGTLSAGSLRTALGHSDEAS